MTRSQLQSAVIQSTILIALEMIISHEISRNAYNNVWEDPVLKNLTTAYKNIPQNATLSSGSEDPWSENPESFYFLRLPRGVLIYALLCPLSYYWHIYLERLFPTRPRGRQVNYEKKEKVEVELNADQEEEVVKRLIAQGKIQRSSVSKWNTLVKWVLHVTVGKVWMLSLVRLILGLTSKSRPKGLQTFKMEILMLFFTSFLSLGPFASLIGFIVVPATKRVVFEEAISAVEAIFFECFYRLAVPWVVQTKLVQGLMVNVTESIILKAPPVGGVDSMNGRLIGEL